MIFYQILYIVYITKDSKGFQQHILYILLVTFIHI